METSTSTQNVPNSGPDNAKSRGASGRSRGKPRRGRGRPRGSRPEPKETTGNGKDDKTAVDALAESSPPKPSHSVADSSDSPTVTAAVTKPASNGNAGAASGTTSSKANAGDDQKKQGQPKRASHPRSKRGRGRGAGQRSGDAKRPSPPTEPAKPEEPVKAVDTPEHPPPKDEQPTVAEPAAAKPQGGRPRLQADVKELLRKRVQEALVGPRDAKVPLERSKMEQKQEEKVQEEVKNEQDEEVEDEVDDALSETTGEDEEKDVKEPAKEGAKSRKRPKRKKATKAEKEAKQEAHFQLVMEAARTVVQILKDRGIECAVFGSLAARLYGSYRCPKDVDMLVLQDPSIPPEQQLTAEQLKVLFLDASPYHFYLTLPRNPEDTYKILHYRREYLGAECKVDILVPGTMYLPHTLSPNDELTAARWVDEIPLVPFGLLLLHKLQGWDDHRLAEEEFRQKKQVQDAADVKKILAMDGEVNNLVKTVSTVAEQRWWKDPILFCEEFRDLTKRRVEDYCKEFQNLAKTWKKLGFDVPEAAPQYKKPNTKSSKPDSTAKAATTSESRSHPDAEVGQVLPPPAPQALDIQPQSEPKDTDVQQPEAGDIGQTASVSIPTPPFPRVKEVLDGIVTEGTLFTPGLDDPVSPDEIVCRVGGLTDAPEIVPVVGGGGLSATPAMPETVTVAGGG